jgi:hypothetical protein
LIIQCAAAIAVAPGVDIPFDRRHDLSRLPCTTPTGAIDSASDRLDRCSTNPASTEAIQLLAAHRRPDI